MQEISDIKITGIDETRLPRIRKEPYIDFAFKLSHKAPQEWCKNFNDILAKYKYSTKINPDEGLFIETWVRNPDEIVDHLQFLKNTVTECSRKYIEKIAKTKAADDAHTEQSDSGEQGKLNKIIAGLDYSI